MMFVDEPAAVQPVWAEIMNRPRIGASSWTDAYLAAFAKEHQYELVTFDRGFERWRDIHASILIGL